MKQTTKIVPLLLSGVLLLSLGSCQSMDKGDVRQVPEAKPADWQPIQFNMARGLAGAIPKSYHDEIKSKTGDKKHLGKHLPYVPDIASRRVPKGYIPIMWGDPSKGYAQHPNTPRTKKDPDGHWYTWIKIRKATPGQAEEMITRFDNWPKPSKKVDGKIIAHKGRNPIANSGKNSVYLAKLPKDVQSGDTIRVWAYCINHGEYVDFIQVP